MSIIVEITVPAEGFELGRILRVEGATSISLETMVPLGRKPTPFVQVRNDERERFERSVREHPSVTEIHPVNTYDDETLYALDWEPSENSLVRIILDLDTVLLEASGTADSWELEFRFPNHDVLSTFQEYYTAENIPVSVNRIYNPTKPDAGPWFGLTGPQRETLGYAVENGYYSLPRQVSTKDLAGTFDVSDQAVTERLRRGISTLVSNTLLIGDDDV